MGILDDYFNQASIDKANQNNDYPKGDGEYSFCGSIKEDCKKEFEEKLESLRNDPNDIEVAYRKFQEEYVKITEEDIDKSYSECVEYVTPKVVVKKFKCPECGKDIVSKSPVMYNPFTLEKIAKHECECGFKCNLEYAYPRLMVLDENGDEIIAYPR